MPDVLIRDLSDDIVSALDTRAARLGLSRSEYVRRRLTQEVTEVGTPLTVDDLVEFSRAFGDLADPEVMRRAWR